MTTATKPTPEITRAAERYLEQYGDPLVMNTYFKVIILVLAVVCLALAALVFRGQKALANMHPLIVRINDVGRAEAIDYRNFQYRPQEAENKYYLTRWAELYFSRNRFTIERDQTNSLTRRKIYYNPLVDGSHSPEDALFTQRREPKGSTAVASIDQALRVRSPSRLNVVACCMGQSVRLAGVQVTQPKVPVPALQLAICEPVAIWRNRRIPGLVNSERSDISSLISRE
jgi:hypothetical protein